MEDSTQRLCRTHLHIKPCLNTTECKEKQMLEKNQTEETFQYTSGMHENELLPNMPSQSHSKGDTLDVKETSSPFHSKHSFKKICKNYERYTTTTISDQLIQ